MLTEDSDSLAYLCCAVILHWNSDTEQVACAGPALHALGFTPEQFQDFCVLLGNDFNERVRGLGPVKAHDLLKRFGTLEAVLDWGDRTQHAAIRELDAPSRERLFESRRIFRSTCFEDDGSR